MIVEAKTAKVTVECEHGSETFEIIREHMDTAIWELVEAIKENQEENHLVDYLKQKYDCYGGEIPFTCLEDELLWDEKKIMNAVGCHLGLLPQHVSKKRNSLFVPVELVAELILSERFENAS